MLTTLISREKLSKKNLVKMLGFCQIEFLDKNLTFRIVCDDNTVVENGTKNETFFCMIFKAL